MNTENKGHFHLKWPWNWVVGGLFIVAAWWFVGIFSILLVALLIWWQKRQYPDAVPQGGFCLDRTRKRLFRLVWALLYFFIAFCCGIVFCMHFQEDRSVWDFEDWAMLIVSGAVSLGAALLCVYETYTDLRDAIFPAKSRLAKSIRSQMPYPDTSLGVAELFAMVDQDIQENGMWFDRVAIGHEWILGDEATSIPRIRGVFSRNETKTHNTGNHWQTTRIIQLWLVDDRKQTQCTDLRNPSELEMALNCLHLRVPEALFDDYGKLSRFVGQPENEWQAMERDFCYRRDQRLVQQAQTKCQNTDRVPIGSESLGNAHLAREVAAKQFASLKEQLRADDPKIHGQLSISDRSGITRDYHSFTHRDIELACEGLSDGKYTKVAFFTGAKYLYLEAGGPTDGLITVNASRPEPDKLRVFETTCTIHQAREWLLQMSEGVFSPDFSQWKDVTKKMEKQIKK